MSIEDKTLRCSDCGDTFTFTAGEQKFFESKGFTNVPKRCVSCRRAKKRENGSSNLYSYSRR
jgi:hypothetical protein